MIGPIVVRYDAVSTAIYDTYRILTSNRGLDVSLLTIRNDRPDVPAHIVRGLADLLLHPAFLTADVLIYDFAFYNALFDALLVGRARATQIVRFHNITPAHLVSPEVRPGIAASYRQLQNLRYADEIWAVSHVNAETLAENGIHGPQVRVIPLIVDGVSSARLSVKSADRIELVFIGRIVPSKGVLDLINAIARVPLAVRRSMRLRIAGNLEWVNPRYLSEVRAAIALHGLENIIELCGEVDDAGRENLLHVSHILVIPSFHEGFCKPVIEGLRAGCIPVGYAAYNLPTIASGFGRMVAPGDVDALAVALTELASNLGPRPSILESAVLPLDRGPTSVGDFDRRAANYVAQFTSEYLAPVIIGRVNDLGQTNP